jgi:hypothetical protein
MAAFILNKKVLKGTIRLHWVIAKGSTSYSMLQIGEKDCWHAFWLTYYFNRDKTFTWVATM